MIRQIIMHPAMAVANFNVPQAMPMTMTDRINEVSSVSLRTLRNRTMAKMAIKPKAVTRLLDRTSITIDTIVGITTSEFTNDLE